MSGTAIVCAPRVSSREWLLRLFTKAPKAFWRFDIDLSLERAADMARLAQIAGITGTFYVMCRSPFYNPASRPGLRALREIDAAGQRLGLHVDYREGDVEQAVWEDVKLAMDWLYADPMPVSFHMPPATVLWRDFDGFDNAYASRWKGHYVSDSRREWTPEKEARVSDNMQICLHPEHWF